MFIVQNCIPLRVRNKIIIIKKYSTKNLHFLSPPIEIQLTNAVYIVHVHATYQQVKDQLSKGTKHTLSNVVFLYESSRITTCGETTLSVYQPLYQCDMIH